MQLLYSAKSFETAYVVEDWPWGYTLKTECRFWIETTSRGDRFCKQTKNPKTGKWCKPKKSTYDAVAILTKDNDGKIFYLNLDNYASEDRIANFISKIDYERLSDQQKKQICKLNAWANVMSKVTWEIRKDDGRSDAEVDAEQDEIKARLAALANAKAAQCMAKNGLV